MKTVTLYRPARIGSIGNVFNDFDRYLDSFFGDSPFGSVSDYAGRIFNHGPAVNIRETGDAYLLEAELPGFDEKNIEVRLEGNTLTIESRKEETAEEVSSGERDDEKAAGAYILRERRDSSFSRSFTLPENADRESVSASFRNGILNLEIRKLPEEKKRVIQIERD